MVKHSDFKARHWNYLNKAPKFYRARTYPELKKLADFRIEVEREKNIKRSKEEAHQLAMQEPELLQIFKKYEDAVFGTASGSGWYHAEQAKQYFIEMLIWSDVEFASFFITIWFPDIKLWKSIKDLVNVTA